MIGEERKMDNILDFIQASFPWIVMGLLLAIFSARSAAKKRKNDNKSDDYGTEGMVFSQT